MGDFLFFQSISSLLLLSFMIGPIEASRLYTLSLDGQQLGGLVLSIILLSFLYQVSLIGLVQHTTPLTKEVISQSKTVPQMIVAILVFSEHFTVVTIIGGLCSVTGSFVYSYLGL